MKKEPDFKVYTWDKLIVLISHKTICVITNDDNNDTIRLGDIENNLN